MRAFDCKRAALGDPRPGDAREPYAADAETIAAAVRTLLLFAVVVAAFGGTAYAAMRLMDTGPDAKTLRAERAKQDAAFARKERKARTRRPARRNGRAAAAATPVSDESRARRRWAAKADAACTRAYDDAVELVATSPVEDDRDLIRLLDASLQIGARFISDFERLGPAPNRRLYARLMTKLRAGQQADTRAVRALKAHWSATGFDRLLKESARRNKALQGLTRRLGAAGCSEFFDPVGYG
jgi:hypothetical protein